MLEKEKILAKMLEIDETKRNIRRQIRSEGEDAKKNRRQVNHSWIAKAKDKINHLIEDRDALRLMLGELKERKKEDNRILNRSTSDHRIKALIQHEFLSIARDRLNPSIFDEIYDEAVRRAVEKIDS